MIFHTFAYQLGDKFQGFVVDELNSIKSCIPSTDLEDLRLLLGEGRTDLPWQIEATKQYQDWVQLELEALPWTSILLLFNPAPVVESPLTYDPSTGLPASIYLSAEQYRTQFGYTWRFNPWTSYSRSAEDVLGDPQGRNIVPPQE